MAKANLGRFKLASNVTLGNGQFAYDVVENWEKLPDGIGWRETAGVITDVDDNVYVFSRGDHPMVVFDKDGNFIKTWGEGVFTRAHGVSVGPDNTLYCTRRRRSHSPPMHAGRRGTDDYWRPRTACGSPQQQAVQQVYARRHRSGQWRSVHLGRIRQRQCPQVQP